MSAICCSRAMWDARPILRDPVRPTKADILISESTYGDRLHPTRTDVAAELGKVVRETFDRGGRLLIPAFAVGRTQRLVYHLHELINERSLPPVPIFVDSPLATNVTEVFREHPECYDSESLASIDGDDDPLGFSRLTLIRDVEASKALNSLRVPCVIISASGMCEGGRVLHHLKHIAPDDRNTILLVGFMAEHTLGRRLSERVPKIKLYGEDYPLKARIASIHGLSAHADKDELCGFLSELERLPEATFLVHGEFDAAQVLAEELRVRKHPSMEVPQPGKAFEF